jgi:hypothetical protein
MAGKISGADLVPMAFESELSVLMRIAWRNAFGTELMREYLSSLKFRFQLCHSRLGTLLGWTLGGEELTAANYYNATIYFIAPLFRYCPVCLEGGYHSYLFQCLEIRCCPLHDIPFSMKCQCCGATTLPYLGYEAWFGRPYYCTRCQRPICGAEPFLEAHLDFRATGDCVFETLRPHFDSWGRRYRARLDANRYGPDFATMRATYAERAELMLGLADLVKKKDRSLRALRGVRFNNYERTLMGAQIDEGTIKHLIWAQRRNGNEAACHLYPEFMRLRKIPLTI